MMEILIIIFLIGFIGIGSLAFTPFILAWQSSRTHAKELEVNRLKLENHKKELDLALLEKDVLEDKHV